MYSNELTLSCESTFESTNNTLFHYAYKKLIDLFKPKFRIGAKSARISLSKVKMFLILVQYTSSTIYIIQTANKFTLYVQCWWYRYLNYFKCRISWFYVKLEASINPFVEIGMNKIRFINFCQLFPIVFSFKSKLV